MTASEADGQANIRRSLRILVAEDNLANQKLVNVLLRRAGHTVDIVADGQEAVDALYARSYDLVLMDIHMPRMDGVTAMQRIRDSGGAGATIPIIAVTAKAMKGDRENYLAAGMDDYVSKPIMDPELQDAIARQCANMAD